MICELPHPFMGWNFLLQLGLKSFKPHLDLKSFNLSIGTSLSSSGVYCMIYYIYIFICQAIFIFYCLVPHTVNGWGLSILFLRNNKTVCFQIVVVFTENYKTAFLQYKSLRFLQYRKTVSEIL